MKRLFLAFFAIVIFVCLRAKEGFSTVLKIASIAPENSAWGEAYRKFVARVEELTNGELTLMHYPGGVMGDEPSIVRKMKLGQLHGAALTEFGLGIILPPSRLLNLVLFYRNYGEWDYIREKLIDDFRDHALKKNFVLIGWTEIGPVRFFSKQKLDTFEAFKKARFWIWAGDPLVKLLAEKGLGVTPIILTLSEVLPGLQTGMIDTFYCPPYAALALQWYKEANYVSSEIAGYTSGAMILTEKAFKSLPPSHREALIKAWDEVFPWLRDKVRELNEEAYKAFLQQGLKPVKMDPELIKELEARSGPINEEIARMVNALPLYHKILKLLQEYRSNSVNTNIQTLPAAK